MSNFKSFYLFFVFSLGTTCLLTLGCSNKLIKSVSPSSTPIVQSEEDRTNERLKGMSIRDKNISQSENHFIKYFAADQSQRADMREQILKDAEFIKSLGRNCPGHLSYLADYLQFQYKVVSEPKYDDPLQQAAYDYLISRSDLVKELTACRQYRAGNNREFTALNHLVVGMISRERADFLKNLVAKVIPLEQLRGKCVADVGGGIGLLLAELVPYVQPEDSGQLICIDVEPKLAELSRFFAGYDPAFGYIDYRLTTPENVNIPLNDKVDLICIFDVHNVYNKFSLEQEEQRRKFGKDYLSNLKTFLKDDGAILIYDSAELMAPVKVIEEIAESAGFKVNNLPINEANGHYLIKLSKT